jgi:hypothetical protein
MREVMRTGASSATKHGQGVGKTKPWATPRKHGAMVNAREQRIGQAFALFLTVKSRGKGDGRTNIVSSKRPVTIAWKRACCSSTNLNEK